MHSAQIVVWLRRIEIPRVEPCTVSRLYHTMIHILNG
jgi:hypothetical protein